jgi:hypothetical protein
MSSAAACEQSATAHFICCISLISRRTWWKFRSVIFACSKASPSVSNAFAYKQLPVLYFLGHKQLEKSRVKHF